MALEEAETRGFPGVNSDRLDILSSLVLVKFFALPQLTAAPYFRSVFADSLDLEEEGSCLE